MSRPVTFVDTSVLVEIPRVPGKCQRHDEIAGELRRRIGSRESMILPTAAIIETGNHIAQLPDGGDRRRLGAELAKFLRAAIADDPPWTLNGASWNRGPLAAICCGARGCPALPEMLAQKVGVGDISILAEAAAYEARVASVSVAIWTLDIGLSAYA